MLFWPLKQRAPKPRFSLKKTYSLQVEGKNRDRLLDASKHDIRKYVKRERSKPLPDGVNFWDFDCKLGFSPAESVSIHFAALMPAIDTLLADGNHQFYVEVVAKFGHRAAKPTTEKSALNQPAADDSALDHRTPTQSAPEKSVN